MYFFDTYAIIEALDMAIYAFHQSVDFMRQVYEFYTNAFMPVMGSTGFWNATGLMLGIVHSDLTHQDQVEQYRAVLRQYVFRKK